MMTVREVKEWLGTLDDDDAIGVDDGGLCLRAESDREIYCEVGGFPVEDSTGTCKHCRASGPLGTQCSNCEPSDGLGPMYFTEC